jgi:glycine/D-amino acid oxidase-like deaminating enzyme
LDLTSPQAFWLLHNGLGDVPPPLSGSRRCDVAVIGGGITGALCADELTEAGLSVVIVDKRHPGLGSTSASTALLQYELDESLTDLTEKVGRQRATDAYRAALSGVRAVSRISRALQCDVGLHQRSTLYVASTKKDAKTFAGECTARRKMGLSCEYLNERELRDLVDFDAPAALRTSAGAEVDPWRLTQALLARARKRGCEIFGKTETLRIVPTKRIMELHTDRGRISAQHVVVATGYEAERFLPKPVAKLHSTYAIATEPVMHFDGWPSRALIWESARPYLYMRTTQENRIVVGGADDSLRDPEVRDRRVNTKARQLLLKVQRHFPRIEMQIAFAWAGTFGETKDSLPFIGPHPELDNRVLFALGYGANGIPFAAVAAQVVTARITGGRHRYDNTFVFDR